MQIYNAEVKIITIMNETDIISECYFSIRNPINTLSVMHNVWYIVIAIFASFYL